jgi:Arc/MetJ-type ribon-helix-helix transcriptional regulator
MSEALSPEVERLVTQHVDGERFTSANDVMLAAMRLFDEFQRRSRAEVGAAIKTGFDELDRGESIELEDDNALRSFFDDIKRRGKERYDASRST